MAPVPFWIAEYVARVYHTRTSLGIPVLCVEREFIGNNLPWVMFVLLQEFRSMCDAKWSY